MPDVDARLPIIIDASAALSRRCYALASALMPLPMLTPRAAALAR